MQASRLGGLALAAFLACAVPDSSGAQGFEKGQGEVAGFAGGVFGIGSNLAYGGGVAAAPSERLLVGGELTYIPGGKSIGTPSGSLDIDARAIDVNGGVQYLFSPRTAAQPFVSAGAGIIHGSVEVPGFTASDSAFALHVGGGVRYWVGDRWGLRPEIKLFLSDTNYVRASVGVFFKIGR